MKNFTSIFNFSKNKPSFATDNFIYVFFSRISIMEWVQKKTQNTNKDCGRKLSALFAFVLLLCLNPVFGQTTFSWRNDQNPISRQWKMSSYCWNGSSAALPGGGEILFLDGNAGTSLTNDLLSANRYKIIFGNTNSLASRTISGSTQNQFFEYSTTWSLIQNDASVLHTINFAATAAITIVATTALNC